MLSLNWNRRDQTLEHRRQLLGWTSLAIGVAEIAAPSLVQTLLGIPDRASHRGVLRILGARELAHGASLLAPDQSQGKMSASLWGRVAGDALDTAALAVAAPRSRNPLLFAATASVVGAFGVLDLCTAMRSSNR